MSDSLRQPGKQDRRATVLVAARWCFLNFGFAKTSFEDISVRSGLPRTALYRLFNNKEEIFQEVFADWLIAREPAAKEQATRPGSASERLLGVCRVLALEPWSEMVNAPMSGDFQETCERIDAKNARHHHEVLHECVASVLGDRELAEVFVLAFQGLFADTPQSEVLEARVKLLIASFTSLRRKRKERHGSDAT